VNIDQNPCRRKTHSESPSSATAASATIAAVAADTTVRAVRGQPLIASHPRTTRTQRP
jgi:hypothetical protein